MNQGRARHLPLVTFVVVLMAVVGAVIGLGVNSAKGDQGAAAQGAAGQQSSPSYVPTAQQTKEALESAATEEPSPAETDPTAARELPHQNLDRGEALALAEGVFGDELENQAGILDSLEGRRFLSDNAVILPESALPPAMSPEPAEGPPEPSANQEVLVESSVPLRTEDADGQEAPVDLGLESAGPGGELTPANPLTEVEVPGELGEGLKMPESEVGITVSGAPQNEVPSNVEGQYAFFPNIAEDMDLIVAPTARGVDMMTDVRSAEAPRTTTYELSLPAGAELEPVAGGAAEVVQEGQTAGLVTPPTAIDAAGEPVEVSMIVEGNKLVVTLTPRPATQYPVLVDPEYLAQSWNWTGLKENFTGWTGTTSGAGYNPYEKAHWENPETASVGLDLASGGAAATSGTHADWYYQVPRYAQDMSSPKHVPPTTWINSVATETTYFIGNEFPSQTWPAFVAGLAEPASSGFWLGETQQAYYGYGGQFENKRLNFAAPKTYEEGGVLKGGDASKEFDMDLVTYENEYAGARVRNAYIGGTYIALIDNEAPLIKTLTSPTGWVTGSSESLAYELEDTGLGVQSAKVRLAGASSFQTGGGFNLYCSGTTLSVCPRSVASTETSIEPPRPKLLFAPSAMPTGEDKLEVEVGDPFWTPRHIATRTVPVKVDNTPPELSLSGSLTEQATLGDRLNEYKLAYSATDGNASVAQSGVVKVEVKVDGKVVQSTAPGCATKNCAISKEWPLNASQFSYGKHKVEVIATDGVGLKTTKVIPIELLDVQTPPVAAWSFDEDEGTVAHDATGNAHEATLSAEGVSWAPGRFGDSLKFDGSKGCVTVPDSPALQLKEEFTLESWIRPQGELTHLPIIYKEGGGFPSYDLGIGLTTAGRGEGQIGTIAKGHSDAATPAAMEAGVWQHLAVTFDGAKLRLYLNGALVTTRPVSETDSGEPGALTIGCGGGYHFRGRIDEVKIYNRALEAGEVAVDREAPIQTPQTGPVAAWSFDEGANPARDSVEGGPEGTLSAEGWKLAAGHFGSSIEFEGINGCLTVPDSPALQLREEFTLEAWVRPEGELSHLPVITKQAEGFPAYGLGIGMASSGRAAGQIGTESKGTSTVESPMSLEAEAWQHEAVTFDGNKLRLYVNGALVATKAVEKTNSAAPGPLEIGCSSGYHFRGRIDEVKIYNRALEAGEVAVDREAPIQTPQTGPVADWSFDEGEGTVAHDATGDAHEATLSAEGVSWAPGRFGDSLKFDGSKGCLTVPDSPALQLGEEFTLEAWVRPEGELTHLPILYKDGGSFPAYDLGIGLSEAGRGEGQIGTIAKAHVDARTAAGAITANAWQHLAVTFDGARLKLYLNGTLVATEPVPAPNSAAPGALTIGCSGGYDFRGRIDEVKIYNRALEAGEVANSMTPQPQVAAGAEATTHEDTEAILTGTVNPRGTKTGVSFEYGKTTAYGSVWPPSPRLTEQWLDGTKPQEVEQAVDELEPGATYHYRVVATTATSRVVGPDQVFTTSENQTAQLVSPAAYYGGPFGINWNGRGSTFVNEEAMKNVAASHAHVFRTVLYYGQKGTQARKEAIANDDNLFTFMSNRSREIAILPDVSGIPVAGVPGNQMPKFEGSGYQKIWEEGLELLVRRYGPEGRFWEMHPELDSSLAPELWEIWNEENTEHNADAGTNKVDPRRYGELLAISHRVLEGVNEGLKGDHKNQILFGGLVSVGGDVPVPIPAKGEEAEVESEVPVGKYLREAGHFSDYAAVSIHPYAFMGTPGQVTTAVRRNIEAVRMTLNHHEGKEKKLWVTEMGWPVEGEEVEDDKVHVPVSAEEQANRLTAVFNMMKAVSSAKGIAAMFWYNIEDVRGDAWESHCGLIDRNGGRRPSFTAFLEEQ